MSTDNNNNISSKRAVCVNCLKENQSMQKCSRCKTASYCSVTCQRADWPVHKNVCINSNLFGSRSENLEVQNVPLQMMKAVNYSQQGKSTTVVSVLILKSY